MSDSSAAERLPHGRVTAGIINAFFETVGELGYGFSEKVCRRAVAIVLRANGFKALEEVSLVVNFRGQVIGSFFVDLVVDDVVLVEVKTTVRLEPYNEAQLLNYLKAAGGGVGLLLNFGRSAQFKRLVSGDPENSLPLLNPRPPEAPGGDSPTRQQP
jgi:GxxExxY protein